MTDNPSPEPTMAFVKFLIDPVHQEPWKRAGFELLSRSTTSHAAARLPVGPNHSE
jgi:hypothetical protein